MADDYPGYDYGLRQAADQAKRLGILEISAIELGVGKGNGLLYLQHLAGVMFETYGIRVKVIGFDSGKGLPEPQGYRDLPYAWKAGDYPMDEDWLRARLNHQVKLYIGDVANTLAAKLIPAPIGFIAFDLDYYSSTTAALEQLDTFGYYEFLPRPFFYFDDVVGDHLELHCHYIGELQAIFDFNSRGLFKRVIAPIHGLEHKFGKLQPWMACMQVLHIFHHPLYNKYIR